MTPNEKQPFKETEKLGGYSTKNAFYRFARWLGFSVAFGLVWSFDAWYSTFRMDVHVEWIAALISAIGSMASMAGSSISASRMNKRAEKFGREQAELNRNFQSQQADINRTWSENYYNQYESPAAMVRQYEQAGINPALMYSGGAQGPTAPTVPSAPSGSMPSVPSYHVPDWSQLGSIMQDIATVALTKAQKDNVEADTRLKEAQTGNVEADTDVKVITVEEKRSNIKKNEKELDYISSQINKNGIEMVNLIRQGKLIEASEELSRRQSRLILSQIGLNEVSVSKVNAEILSIMQGMKESDSRIQLQAAYAYLARMQGDLAVRQAGKTEKETFAISLENFERGYKNEYTRVTGLKEPPSGVVGAIYNIIAGLMVRYTAGHDYNFEAYKE